MVCFLKNLFHCHHQWEHSERTVCVGTNFQPLQKSVKAKSLNRHELLAVICSFKTAHCDELSFMIQPVSIFIRNENQSIAELSECSSEKQRENIQGEKILRLSFLLWIGVMENVIPQSSSWLLFITQYPLAFQLNSCWLSCFCWTISMIL